MSFTQNTESNETGVCVDWQAFISNRLHFQKYSSSKKMAKGGPVHDESEVGKWYECESQLKDNRALGQ